MSANTVLWTIAVVALGVVAWIALDRFQRPRERTKRLVMTVWAAFAPYQDAEDAATGLRRAYKAVFGQQPAGAHEEWLNGHIQNLREAESEGRFEFAQKIMRGGLLLTAYGEAFDAACNKVRAQLVDEMQEAANALARDFPPLGDMLQPTIDHHRRRLGTEKPDGSAS